MRRQRSRRSWLRYAFACAGLLPACTLHTRDGWQAPVARRHQLVGEIWDVHANRPTSPDVLLTTIARVPFVLLGEKHDNPDHHRLQARIVRHLHAARRRPAIVFEMLSVEVTPALGQALAAPHVTPADIRTAVEWDESGWPPWEMYAPIFDAALSARLPIAPGNLPRDTVATLHRGGRHALPPQQQTALGLDEPIATERQRIMFEQIRDAHCGFAPDDLVVRMIDAQRARDAQLARKLIAAGEADGAVLIAGTEHVRRDTGVPVYLAELAPGRTVTTVGFMEVSREHASAVETLAARYGHSVPFDYVWFTPRVDDEDPCARFRQQLERLRTKGDTPPPSP